MHLKIVGTGWRESCSGERIEPEFYYWFVSEKSKVIRNNMIQSVRIAAQLGNTPKTFYTNASESMNNILKLKVDRKPQSLPAFVDHIYELVTAYEKNLERSICRRGDWCLVDTFIPPEDMSESSQKKLVTRILQASCSLSKLCTEASGQHSMSTVHCQSSSRSPAEEVEEVQELSMS